MIAAELMNAQQYPVYEQRYKADPDNPLSLFDCMKPQLHGYIQKPIQMLPQTHRYDLKWQIDLKHAEDKDKECKAQAAQLKVQ